MNRNYQASLSELHAMLEFIESFAKISGFIGNDIGKIILVSEEVLVNIISYGYPSSRGEISITCDNLDEFIEITIKDQGVAYNPLTHNPQKKQSKIDKKGGFGIILVLQMMDQVNYSRVENSNILKLIKKKSL